MNILDTYRGDVAVTVQTDNGRAVTMTPFVDRVLDNVFIGNGVGACSPELIQVAGINAIVNMALEYHPEELYAFPVARIGMRGNGQNPGSVILSAVDTFTDFISQGKKVLSHCHAGCDRSVCVVLGYLVQSAQCQTIAEALKFVNARRMHKTQPNADLRAHFARIYDRA